MNNTGISSFDRTVQTTIEWLNEIMDELPTNDRQKAYRVLRATLQTLRDRLTVEEATDLGAQLPMLVRGFYYEGWNPTGKPEKLRTLDEFLDHVEESFPRGMDVDSRRGVEVVFGLLGDRVSAGELEDIQRMLPKPIRQLWPRSASASA